MDGWKNEWVGGREMGEWMDRLEGGWVDGWVVG